VASPLNNPWVVGGLVVGGACYALYTYVPADWLERLEGSSKTMIPPPIHIVSPQSLNPDNRFFVARPQVLPGKTIGESAQRGFSWDIFYETPKLGINREPTPLPADWKLTGVYLDENREPPVRAAVVSGDILRPGGKKGEFVVEEITADSVIFSHPTGKQTLTFQENKAQKKK